jgi:hypothetical protein
MPKIRIGFSTDFNLVNEQVGIGTTNPESRLNVPGQILADNTAGSGGVSTYREYQGFYQTQSNVSNTVLIDATTAGNLNSLSGELRIDGDVTIAPDTSVTSGKIDSLTATDKFAVPLGDTNSRDNTPEAGTTRFNQDFGTLEFFDGVNWKTLNSYARYHGGAAGRAVYSGGLTPSVTSTIDYYNIHTLGNAMNFGDATIVEGNKAGCSSAIRGLSGGSGDTSNDSTIDYVTIASTGDAIDFGDLYNGRGTSASMSSSTRGLWAAGRSPTNQDTIDYVEIATIGNALDFGDTTVARQWSAGCSSSTRGIIAGGENNPFFPSPGRTSRIEFITMASKGDAILFGDLTATTGNPGGCSNSTRGFFGGGEPQTFSKIDMITIASTGNAVEFGNLTVSRITVNGAGSQTRGTFLGGWQNLNTIDYITMSTEGDAIDFGDLTIGRWSGASFSDSHGGLGGF